MTHCERLVIDGAKSGGTPWPPTYGEFIGYCEPKKEPSIPAAYKTFARGLPEPEDVKVSRKKEGQRRCQGLLDMLDE